MTSIPTNQMWTVFLQNYVIPPESMKFGCLGKRKHWLLCIQKDALLRVKKLHFQVTNQGCHNLVTALQIPHPLTWVDKVLTSKTATEVVQKATGYFLNARSKNQRVHQSDA